jgi:hypothetical protein
MADSGISSAHDPSLQATTDAPLREEGLSAPTGPHAPLPDP